MAGELKPIMLLARTEEDGTLSLNIDAPQSDALPVSLGGGFQSLDQILQAIVASLTAPAVSEDRIATLEEMLPGLNQVIDTVNAQSAAMEQFAERLTRVEDAIEAILRAMPEPVHARPATGLGVGRIPRLGQGSSASWTSVADGLAHTAQMARSLYESVSGASMGPPPPPGRQPYARPASPTPPAPPAAAAPSRPAPHPLRPENEGPRPSFDRGSFRPHFPIGRVSHGPGSPDYEAPKKDEENEPL